MPLIISIPFVGHQPEGSKSLFLFFNIWYQKRRSSPGDYKGNKTPSENKRAALMGKWNK